MSEPKELPSFQLLQDEMEVDDATFAVLLDSSSDEDEEGIRPWGGSKPGKAPNKKRDFHGAYERVVRNYFNGRESKFRLQSTRNGILKGC